MQWYLAVWKNYLGFEGRASRTEYWMFIRHAVKPLALAMGI